MALGRRTMSSGLTTLMRSMTVMLLAMLLTGCDEKTSDTFAAKIGDRWFTLETAIDKAKQARGLGGRTEIPADGGMIFIFDDDQERQFWMLDCLVDMDILYVDRNGFIVSGYTMKAVPLKGESETQAEYEARLRRDASYPSRGRARYVIELQAGMIGQLDLERGQKLDLDLKRLEELAEQGDDDR